MNAFEFMILENMGMTTTTLGRKNKVFKYLDELKRRGVNIDVDIITGKSILRISTTSGGTPIYQFNAQYGVPVELAQRTSWTGSEIAAAGTSLITTSISAASGNAAGALIGGIGFIGSIAEGFKESVQSNGINGSFAFLNTTPKLVAESYALVEEDNEHKGRPLCKLKKLNTLSGFIQCAEGDVQIPCTSTERDMISELLTSGFFYE